MLGLSITLAKGQIVGKVPIITSYAAFLGGLGMVTGAFGVIAVFKRVFNDLVPLVIQGIVILLFSVGGAVMAAMIHGGNCNDFYFAGTNKILNCGGRTEIIDGERWWIAICGLGGTGGRINPPGWEEKASKMLQKRCERATADYALMFAIVLLSGIALGLGHVWKRKTGKIRGSNMAL